MNPDDERRDPLSLRNGAARLPLVEVDTYNEELRDAEGFLGDRASSRAFRAILDDWRERMRDLGEDDPLGERSSEQLTKKKLDRVLRDGEPLAAGLVHTAIEDFATELATVTGRFLRLKPWRGTERIIVGGGLRASRVGEVAIGRAAVLVKAAGHAIDMIPIRHHPDEAGLIGNVHLAPSWIFSGSDAMLAVDIGGSNIRAGVVELHQAKAPDLSGCSVMTSELWRHAGEEPRPKREDAVARLVEMLQGLIKAATKAGLTLAPLIGVACPGVIAEDGSIERGGQNLPGNWESSRFNLAARLREGIPRIGGHETHVLIHNDAVVQGLSEAPFMKDVARWGVLTIGTGLGNARFTSRPTAAEDEGDDGPKGAAG
ncbi:MAG: ROK family protein [Labilithrix sp.]|nr:ROK family protein [Labilithrix sp.]MBX3223404.1 ROK family protein [Labilithrix sp.]